jgi:hypothetical protein
VCVCCVSHLLLGETSIHFSRCSFIIHSLTTSFPFLSTGLSPRTKSPKYTQKKVENNRKPISALSNQQQSLSFATHAPYIFPFIFFSQTLSSRLSVHLLHGTTYLSHVILEMRPDLIMVAFRITRHTWKRLPASMLALVNRDGNAPPQKRMCNDTYAST